VNAVSALFRCWWPQLLVTVAVVILRWPTLSNRIFNIDEPTYLAQAARLRSPEAFVYAVLYRTETKTQVGLIPYLLANLTGGGDAMFVLHVFGLLAVLATCWLMIAFADRFLSGRVAGLAAALVWALWLAVGPGYANGVGEAQSNLLPTLLEIIQAPFILATLYMFASGVESGRVSAAFARLLLLCSGAAWATAVLIKPSAALVGPLCLAALPVASHELTGRALFRRCVPAAAAFIVGAALPVALLFVPYLFSPAALSELRFNLVQVNAAYAQGAPGYRRALSLIGGVPAVLLAGWALLPPWVMLRVRRSSGSKRPLSALLLVWLAGLAVLVGSLPGHAFWHYLVPVVPLVALAATESVSVALHRVAPFGRRAPAIVGLLLAACYLAPQLPAVRTYAAGASADSYLDDDRRRIDVDGLVTYVRAHSRPDASIWAYYNTPELYLLADRHPATRDPGGAYLWLFWDEPWFQRTADDLATEQPELIIDIHEPRYAAGTPQERALTRIPRVGALIERDYVCDQQAIRGATVCTRRRPDSS
jgi:hypothetical protein